MYWYNFVFLGSCSLSTVDYSKCAVMNEETYEIVPKEKGPFVHGTTFQIEWNDTDACGYGASPYQCQKGEWIHNLQECHRGKTCYYGNVV